MERRIAVDLVAAAAVLLTSAAGWLGLGGTPFRTMDAGLGPAFFPAAALLVLAALGLLLLLKAIARRPARGTTREPDAEEHGVRALCGMGVLVGYAFLFLYLGCLIATQIALFASMRLLGATWSWAFVFATGATAFIYVLFGIAFGVRL